MALHVAVLVESKLGLSTISSENCSAYVFLTTNISKLIVYLLSQHYPKSYSWAWFSICSVSMG